MSVLSENFQRSEFACKCGCGFDTVDAELIKVLEKIRKHFDRPVIVTSGARCEKYNREVAGGGKHSQHLLGRAADIVIPHVPTSVIAELARNMGVGGVGQYADFVHLDTRSHEIARWTA